MMIKKCSLQRAIMHAFTFTCVSFLALQELERVLTLTDCIHCFGEKKEVRKSSHGLLARGGNKSKSSFKLTKMNIQRTSWSGFK